MESVRRQIIKRFPPPPRATDPEDQLGHALYIMLWSIDDRNVTVDGWTVFKVVRETDVSLDAVGLMTLLPSGSMPISLRLDSTEHGLAWKAQVSLQDEGWLSLSDSKRWNKVYLLANGDLTESPWVWDRSYEGVVAGQTPDTLLERAPIP